MENRRLTPPPAQVPSFWESASGGGHTRIGDLEYGAVGPGRVRVWAGGFRVRLFAILTTRTHFRQIARLHKSRPVPEERLRPLAQIPGVPLVFFPDASHL